MLQKIFFEQTIFGFFLWGKSRNITLTFATEGIESHLVYRLLLPLFLKDLMKASTEEEEEEEEEEKEDLLLIPLPPSPSDAASNDVYTYTED